MKGSPFGRQVNMSVALDQAVGLKPSEQLTRRVGVEVRRALEHAGKLVARERGTTRGDQLQRVPGLGLGVSFGEVVAEDGRQGALGERERLTELPVDGWCCGHVTFLSVRIDRCLSIVSK